MTTNTLPTVPTTAPSWAALRQAAAKLRSTGQQLVLDAIAVGDQLSALRPTCASQKEFVSRVRQEVGFSKSYAFKLMSLAQHQQQVLAAKPESIRQALAVLSPAPTQSTPPALATAPATPTTSPSHPVTSVFSHPPTKRKPTPTISDAELEAEVTRSLVPEHIIKHAATAIASGQLAAEHQHPDEFVEVAIADAKWLVKNLVTEMSRGADGDFTDTSIQIQDAVFDALAEYCRPADDEDDEEIE